MRKEKIEKEAEKSDKKLKGRKYKKEGQEHNSNKKTHT